MPGFDGTGPLGRGPMTGGRRGRCMFPFTRADLNQQPVMPNNIWRNSFPGEGFFRGFFSGGVFGRRNGGRRFNGNRMF